MLWSAYGIHKKMFLKLLTNNFRNIFFQVKFASSLVRKVSLQAKLSRKLTWSVLKPEDCQGVGRTRNDSVLKTIFSKIVFFCKMLQIKCIVYNYEFKFCCSIKDVCKECWSVICGVDQCIHVGWRVVGLWNKDSRYIFVSNIVTCTQIRRHEYGMELLKPQSIPFPCQICQWTDDMGIIWDIPISCYGTDMELYEIHCIPISLQMQTYFQLSLLFPEKYRLQKRLHKMISMTSFFFFNQSQLSS